MNKIDKTKVKYAICIMLWSGLVAYYSQPLVHDNQDAINVIITVFSILAGFLVAVISFIGDPRSLPSGGWQVAQLGSDLINNRLTRHGWLFRAYLITLFLIFWSMVLKAQYPSAQKALEYVYMYITSISCFLSFRLPAALNELQRERLKQEITERRKRENITD